MKNIIKLEELAMLAMSIVGLYLGNVDWWYYLLMALGPDISLLAYFGGNKAGAFCYNLFHHKGIAIILLTMGLFLYYDILVLIGIVMFGHSSMDRVFGYGLKYEEGFKFTHLGTIGKK